MKLLTFSSRTAKEILRDPINLMFGLGFPVVLLALMSAIQANVPVSIFEIENLAPGMTVFGLSFMTLFSATLVAKDRSSAILQRLYTTPLTPADFIAGYSLPVLPMCMAQCAVCLLFSAALGLTVSVRMLWAVLASALPGLFFVSLGLLCGSIFTDKQVGGICGALLTNLSAWLSGIWFDLSLVGGAFQKIAELLPFVHAVRLQQAILRGDYGAVFPSLYWVLAYTGITAAAAVWAFLRQMERQ